MLDVNKNDTANQQKVFLRRGMRDLPLYRFLPNILTIFAICAGFMSIKFTLISNLGAACACILIAVVLDGTDGRVARFLKKETHFGAELDSLADFLNFGIAPGVIIYIMSLNLYGDFGWAISLFATVCCALRLARFNTIKFQYDDNEDDIKKYEFESNFSVGLAAPAGALVVLAPAIFYLATGYLFFMYPICFFISALLGGGLMISKIRTLVLKKVRVTPVIAPLVLIILCVIVIFVFADLWFTLSFLIIAYLFSIPFSNRFYNKKIASLR